MPFDLVSTCGGFLLGAITGAAGAYYGDKFTDQRRKQEQKRETNLAFAAVCKQMPELIAEMTEDLTREPQVRDFYVLPTGAMLGGSSTPAFAYTDQPDARVRAWVSILENHGYVRDITPKNAPMYRMTEEFVVLVKSATPGSVR